MKTLTIPPIVYHALCIIVLLFCTVHAHASPMIVGHRGARGLAPESTLQGYQTAIKLGVQYIDMDIVMTKDHQLVVFHDLALNPTIVRDNKGRWINNNVLIKDLTLHQLQQFNVGTIKPGTAYQRLFPHQVAVSTARIPSLRHVIEYAKRLNPHIQFQIEIKTDPEQPETTFSPTLIAQTLISLLKELEVTDRTRIQAFDWRCLYAVQALNSHVETAYLTSPEQETLMRDANKKIAGRWTGGKLLKNTGDSIPEMIKSLGGKAWDPESHSLTAEDLLRAKKLGLRVFVWSNNKKKDYDPIETKRVLQLEVDGIITDRPDLALHDVKRYSA